MTGVGALVRNELRILRHDPVPAVVLVAMPIVLMTLLSNAMNLTVADEGYLGVTGSAQTVPGMACVFAFFASGILAFAVFREHGWTTWPRLRAAGLSRTTLLVGKLVVPAGLLALQHVVLFGFGVLLLDLDNAGSWWLVGLVATCFSLVVLTAGLAVTALLSTVQQVNAVTNLGAMVLGGLGGGFVPVRTLPEWVRPIAPASPVDWAMDAYRAVILDGVGGRYCGPDAGCRPLSDVLVPCAVLLGFALLLGLIALVFLRPDRPKRTWG
ncbi:ABC transporter permease [Patulibacter defluvii]|uniref:ABC transporter permease n=1 Tax=Patulibacter defluvii TaxID=3095358 RepID=UPI002A75C13E|nr:ABC transporter permease [Patulibacter sp. DM4]